MRREEEVQYYLIIGTELKGSFYANYTNCGGNVYEFTFSKMTNKYYDSIHEVKVVKNLLENVIEYEYIHDKDGYVCIEDGFYENNGKIVNVNVKKVTIKKEIITEII